MPVGMEADRRQLHEKKNKKKKLHLHNKSPTDDMVNCSIIKFFFGLIVEVFLVWTNGLQKLQYVV